jgi:hypothetical protein
MLTIHAMASGLKRVESSPGMLACEAVSPVWQIGLAIITPFPTAAVLGGDLIQGGPELTERSEFIPGTMFQGVQPIQ